jgi:phosphatidylserine decarboxylase
LMFANAIGRTFANSTVPLLHKMSVLQGEKYNKPESSMEIEKFIQIHSLNRDEFDKEISEYENFNEFFARGMRDIDVKRPLASPENHGVAVCPADCRMMVFPELVDATSLWIKGDKFSLENLLGPDASQYAQNFKGGSFVIARLAPQDYHRWHTPVQGVFGKRYPLSGALYTVNPIAINKPVNVYTENKREVCLIDSVEFGAVILIAVAATMVGSINIVEGDEGSECKRGAVHGKFLFGGSTVLVLFQPGTIKFADDLLFNSTHDPKRPIETLVKVRSKLGDAVKPGKRLHEL